jgi:hypothetical protein
MLFVRVAGDKLTGFAGCNARTGIKAEIDALHRASWRLTNVHLH